VQGGEDLNDIKNEPEFVSLRADPRYHLQILNAAGSKPFAVNTPGISLTFQCSAIKTQPRTYCGQNNFCK